MKKALYFILFYCAFVSVGNSQSWMNVGPEAFTAQQATGISLATYDGRPYVAFQDQDASDKISVMRYDGSNWVFVGAQGFTPGIGGGASLAFDGETPYVAFSDISQSGKVSVMKFDGTTWDYVGVGGLSEGGAGDISLTIDQGTPYVGFQDHTSTGGFFKCSVRMFDGINWLPVGEERFSDGKVNEVNLAIINGVPHVAFHDVVNNLGGASVMKFDGAEWVYVGGGPAFSQGTASHVSMAVNNGIPYVAYTDNPTNFKLTVMKLEGNSWTTVGSQGFTNAEAYMPNIAFHNGIPYVAYRDQENDFKTSVRKFENGSWQAVGALGFSAGDITQPKLAFANGIPYVAYRDIHNSAKLTVMRYAIANNTQQIYEASSTSVFPNPVENVLTIKNLDEEIIDEGLILNIKGEQIKKIDRSELNSIDISALEGGTYILQLQTKKGLVNRRFVKM